MFKTNEKISEKTHGKWKIKIRQIVPTEKEEAFNGARGNFFSFFFPFKLESLKKKSLTEQRTLKLLLKPGNKKRVLKLHTNILQ